MSGSVKKSITVAIADDHSLFRKGLKAVLSMFPDVKLVGEAETGEGAMKLVARLQPDVLLMDLVMPDTVGFESIREISENYSAHIIVLSMYSTDNHIVKAIEAGAAAYLDKNADPEEIIQTIEAAYEHGFFYNERTAKLMYRRLIERKRVARPQVGDKVVLTETEVDVLRGIALEMTSEEIGKKLGLSAKRIESIRSEMFIKTGTKNAVGLVIYGIKCGYVEI